MGYLSNIFKTEVLPKSPAMFETFFSLPLVDCFSQNLPLLTIQNSFFGKTVLIRSH